PDAFNTTDVAEAWRGSVRAATPCTVKVSPTFNELDFQPFRSNSSGFPNSTAQLASLPAASRTLMNRNARGFTQSIFVTTPSSVTLRLESYAVVNERCAEMDAAISRTTPMMQPWIPRRVIVASSL